MIDQVLNMKKRYDALVQKFSEEDFKAYFAEFFTLYPIVTYVCWTQLDDTVRDPMFIIAPAYLARHSELEGGLVDEGMVNLVDIKKEHRNTYAPLWNAAVDIRRLLEAKDVLEYVFGTESFVSATPEGVKSDPWEGAFGA
jgi:hypothetical protein